MKRILIIEDEECLLMMMAETLQMLGYTALSAADGACGVQMAIAEQPDFIFCDLNMPGIDGIETLKMIRQTASTANIPFVLLSGFADPAIRRQAAKLGAADFLIKPLSSAELLSTLNSRMNKAA